MQLNDQDKITLDNLSDSRIKDLVTNGVVDVQVAARISEIYENLSSPYDENYLNVVMSDLGVSER